MQCLQCAPHTMGSPCSCTLCCPPSKDCSTSSTSPILQSLCLMTEEVKAPIPPTADAAVPEDAGSTKKFALPAMPAKNSLVAGSLVLWKILAVYCMGVLFIARMPWYLLPIGWALVAAAYSGCLVVGMDCSRSCFFESKAANELVGAVVLLPLFRTLESLRRSKKETSAWLSRLWDCLKTSWSEKCYAISATALIAVSLLGSWYSGLGLMYPVKYWLVPFLYMHLTVGSFTTKSTERYSYLALFPDVKKWAEMEKGMLETMQKASEIIPVYNVKAMHDYVEQQFSNGPNSLKLKQPFHFSLPSTLMNRIMLLRGKRDVILAVAALISLLV